MNKKVLAALLSLFFLITSLPIANAMDIPLLVWERGKEQNIVLGGASPQANWQIKLVKQGANPVNFQPSSRNGKGFLVYSANLPANLPLGDYTVYVFGNESTTGSLVAQVRVTAMTRYSVTQIPKDLALILLVLIFLITMLSTARSTKYAHLSFVRQKTLVESETLLFNKSLPRFAYRPYLLRSQADKTLKPSIFRFLIFYDDTFTHKISPLLWSLFPIVGLLVGIQGGLSTHHSSLAIPAASMIAISAIGILDSYSGVFAASGFAIGQIVMGETLNIRAVMVLGALAIGWVFTSLTGNFLYLTGRKDFPGPAMKNVMGIKDFFLLFTTSCTVGTFFFSTQLLAESISLTTSGGHPFLIRLSVAIGLIFGLKALLHQLLDSRIARGPHSDSLITEEFHVIALISPVWVATVAFSTFFTAYIWAQSWAIAVTTSFLLTALFGSLMVRFRPLHIPFLAKWERNVYIESGLVTFASLWIFTYVSSMPYQILVKSEILMTMGFLLPLLHIILSSLHEVSLAAEKAIE